MSAAHSDREEAPILSERTGALTTITLNRPRAINALTLEMVGLITHALTRAAADGSRAVVIEGAGERGLCGGGDIKAMHAGGPTGATEFIRAEYELDLLTAESAVPVIGFMDGITMGGGIGITGHSAVRVVTERSRLAMPEVKIGIVPDVGGHLLLARAPGRLGEYLAATGGTISAGDAIALGFADLCVPSDRLTEVKRALADLPADGGDPAAIVREFATTPPPAELLAEREWIDPLFDRVLNADPVTLAMARPDGADDLGRWAAAAARELIDTAARVPGGNAEAGEALSAELRQVCPTSLAVTLAQIARTRALDLSLAEVLADDLRIVSRMFHRSDFPEGVRAVVIDKDRNAAWDPADAEGLAPAEVAALLAH